MPGLPLKAILAEAERQKMMQPMAPQASQMFPGSWPPRSPQQMPPGAPFGPSGAGANPLTSAAPSPMPPGAPFGPGGGAPTPPIPVPMSKPQAMVDPVPAKVAQVLAKAPEAKVADVGPPQGPMASQQFPISVGNSADLSADPKQVALQALTSDEPSMAVNGDTSPVGPKDAPKAMEAKATDSPSPWANQDFGSLIRSIGIGLLTSNDPWTGLGKGIQNFENTQRLNKAQESEEKWKTKEFDQRQTQIDNTAKDQEADRASRDANADKELEAANKRMLFQAKQNVEMENLRSQHDSERLAQSGAQARSLAAYNQALDNASPTAALARAKISQINADMDPDDPNAGSKQWIATNGKAFDVDTKSYDTNQQAIDHLNRLDQIADKADVGPDVVSGFKRVLSTTFGIGEADMNTEAGYNSAIQQLDAAVAKMKGQGQITEPERELLKQGIADPTKMTRETLKKVIQVSRQNLKNQNGFMEEWLAKDAKDRTLSKYLPAKAEYQVRVSKTPEGNPASGVTFSTSTGDPEFDKMLGL